MTDGASRPCLSAIFVDYDNIYMSLKRKNEEAAKQFAKNAGLWLKGIESGALITATNAPVLAPERRIVLNRCYGNPVPRRSNKDNSTDMNSFPFVRHHFLRSGFEIIDCPPLTAQLKNSSDIRMVMDVRDLLNHDTYYDEFIILSGDADFTPVLHRLRAHARRTIIYANDYTAIPYTAISDGEIQEKDLINLLITGNVSDTSTDGAGAGNEVIAADPETVKSRIRDEIIVAVSESDVPVPIESLADRAQRSVGYEQTIGTNWVGHGNFLTFLAENLPEHIVLTEHAPYHAIDIRRMQVDVTPERVEDSGATEAPVPVAAPISEAPPVASPVADAMPTAEPVVAVSTGPAPVQAAEENQAVAIAAPAEPEITMPNPVGIQAAEAQVSVPAEPEVPALQQPIMPQAETPVQNEVDATSAIQRSIARIHEACQAPPLAPPEYRQVFEIIAAELIENNLNGQQTIANIVARGQELELDIKHDDVRFIIDVISEADPWFEQGASAALFAGRFRNFVVARCRGQGLKLTADELDLIDAWFAGQAGNAAASETSAPMQSEPASAPQAQPADEGGNKVVSAAQHAPIENGQPMADDELPRIVRSRMRG